ncbi:unnamed protein product, partial [Diplocarpon coronariae]
LPGSTSMANADFLDTEGYVQKRGSNLDQTAKAQWGDGEVISLCITNGDTCGQIPLNPPLGLRSPPWLPLPLLDRGNTDPDFFPHQHSRDGGHGRSRARSGSPLVGCGYGAHHAKSKTKRESVLTLDRQDGVVTGLHRIMTVLKEIDLVVERRKPSRSQA